MSRAGGNKADPAELAIMVNNGSWLLYFETAFRQAEYNSKALNKKVVFLYQKVVTPKMVLVPSE
jgi:hypothetical protein